MSEIMLDHTVLDSLLSELPGAPHWTVGFSGGVDSTVLLHLLHRWCRANPGAPPLTALHVNHGMQSAADTWQVHCEWVCKILHIPVISCAVEVPAGGGEAAAREARYQAFEGQLQPGAILFLGHHLDDQVETFFLRLMRGAGVQGLAAIPARRPLGRSVLARPLLQTTRSQIERYADRHGLKTVEDPSNCDTAMDRNFLRAQLLPLLASRWPGYRQTVARASGHMAGAVAALGETHSVPETVRSVMGDPGLALADLVTVPGDTAAVKLRSWLLAAGHRAPDHAALDEFLRQLRVMDVDANPRLECSAYTLQRYRKAVYLLPDPSPACSTGSFSLTPGEHVEVPGVGRVGLQRTAGAGLSLAPDQQLRLAWRQGGERCRLPGRVGSNSLKKLLQEWQIPPWWRDRVPLLYLGDELLAVGDLAPCESSRWRASAPEGGRLWRVSWERTTNAACD